MAPARIGRTAALSSAVLCAALALLPSAIGSPAAADTVLKASHQWPARMGDFRDEMLQMIAAETSRAGVGATVEVFPGASLVKPRDQWAALIDGRVDITLLPLDYASDRHPEFSATLMPALIMNLEHAKRISRSPFIDALKAVMARDDIFVLADGWLAGAFASRQGCITRPRDVAGLRMRTAGPMFETMLAGAGATLSSMPLADVHAAMRSRQLDATVTSSESLVSIKLYEQSACLTPPGDHAIWFMYEPVLMARRAFERLNPSQKGALLAAARKAESFGYERSAYSDEVMVGLYGMTGVRIATMSAADLAEWRELAGRTSYKHFSETVEGGGDLLQKALAVQ